MGKLRKLHFRWQLWAATTLVVGIFLLAFLSSLYWLLALPAIGAIACVMFEWYGDDAPRHYQFYVFFWWVIVMLAALGSLGEPYSSMSSRKLFLDVVPNEMAKHASWYYYENMDKE